MIRALVLLLITSVVRGFSPTSSGWVIPRSLAAENSPLFAVANDDDDDTVTKKAVVVGAGPAGLLSALILSNLSYDVTCVETALDRITAYDTARAFLYLIDGRGQSALASYPRILQNLQEQAVAQSNFQICIVPPTIDKDVPDPIRLPIVRKRNDGGDSYWIPRHEFVRLLKDEVDLQQDERTKGTERGKVEFLKGKCTNVENGGSVVRTRVDIGSPMGKNSFLESDLVIGADGIKSEVREAMGEWTPDDDTEEITEADRERQRQRFTMKKRRSPAGGLRYKVLQFEPAFRIPQADKKPDNLSISTVSYAFSSVSDPIKAPTRSMRLGLLPIKNSTAVRPANLITRPNHDVWNMRDGETVRQFFAKEFPRMGFDSNGRSISNAEWERFASARGGRFPVPQSCAGLCCTNTAKTCGVVLVGDALHSFPPDVGQGVNSAMGDVKCLEQCLKGDATDLGTACEEYQDQRGPEVSALMRIAAGSNPLQYSQTGLVLQVRKKFWALNFFMRLLLNKVTGGLVPNHSFLLLQDKDLTYQQVMRKADSVTFGLTAFWGWLGYKLLRRIFLA